MLEYLIRVGSCQTYPLLPPSSRCSTTSSQPSPSQLMKVPRSWPSICTPKQTLTAGSVSTCLSIAVVTVSPRGRWVVRGRSVPQVGGHAGALPVQAQLGTQPRGQRVEQAPRELVEVGSGGRTRGRAGSGCRRG